MQPPRQRKKLYFGLPVSPEMRRAALLIQVRVAAHFEISVDAMTARDGRTYHRAFYVALWAVHRITGASHSQLSEIFGDDLQRYEETGKSRFNRLFRTACQVMLGDEGLAKETAWLVSVMRACFTPERERATA